MKSEKTLSDDRADISRAEPAPPWGICLLGIYLILLVVLSVYTMVKIWPLTGGLNGTVGFLGLFSLVLSSEVRLILISSFMGLLGSLIQSMTYFAAYVGHGIFSKRWILWYVLRPFIGVPLALIFYFVLRGGIFSVSAGSEAVNPYGIAALSGLVGMFSKQAVEKLKTIFDSIFKTVKAKK